MEVESAIVENKKNEIRKLEEKNRRYKEEVEKLKKKNSNERENSLTISEYELMIQSNFYLISILRYERDLAELESRFSSDKISERDFKRNRDTLKRQIAEVKKLLSMFEDIKRIGIVQSPNALEVVVNSSKDVYEMDSFIYSLSSFKNSGNVSDKQLDQLFQNVFSTLKLYNDAIRKYESLENNLLESSINNLKRQAKRFKRYDEERYRDLSSTLYKYEYLSSASCVGRGKISILSEEVYKYTNSKDIPRVLNTFPSEKRIDEMRDKCTPAEFSIIISLKNDLRNLDIINTLEEMINNTQIRLKEQYVISGETIDFRPFLTALNQLSLYIKKTKAELEEKLKEYYKIKSKIEKQERREVVTHALSSLYKELKSLDGYERTSKLEEIKVFKLDLIAEGFSDTEISHIDSDARDILREEQDEKDRKERERIEKEKYEGDKADFIRQGLDPETYERIKRDAIMAAKRRFPETIYANGDYGTSNPEFDRFVNSYIVNESSRILGNKFDDQRREMENEFRAQMDLGAKIGENGLSDEMLEFATMQLYRNKTIDSFEYDKLTLPEKFEVVNYAIRMKGLVGKTEDEIAASLAKEPYTDDLGRFHKIEGEPDQFQILAQKNLNAKNGIVQSINRIFGQKNKI